jgi:hypothetical protein
MTPDILAVAPAKRRRSTSILCAQTEPALWDGLVATGAREDVAARRRASVERAHDQARADHAARLSSLREAERCGAPLTNL